MLAKVNDVRYVLGINKEFKQKMLNKNVIISYWRELWMVINNPQNYNSIDNTNVRNNKNQSNTNRHTEKEKEEEEKEESRSVESKNQIFREEANKR